MNKLLKTREIFLKIFNRIFILIITFLGFSCIDDPVDEYGMPTADFKLSGTIIDENTLNALSNIGVVMQNDTVYSNETGEYEIIVGETPDNQIYNVQFLDLDGDLNGKYLPKDTIVDYLDINFQSADGNWYEGEKAIELNIKLTPDNSND